jgi:hypothetical protein
MARSIPRLLGLLALGLLATAVAGRMATHDLYDDDYEYKTDYRR